MKIKNPFLDKKNWVLDGGLGTELMTRGFDLKHPLWSAKVLAEDPKAIFSVHKSYLEAGADIILTASYQASIEGFVRHLGMYPREAQEVLFFTVELACRARDEYLRECAMARESESGDDRCDFRGDDRGELAGHRQILVGASVGPYGAILADGSEFSGEYDVSSCEVGDYYAHKIEHLILPRGVGIKKIAADFLAFETIPTKKEAELIQVILKTIPWARSWISFSNPEALLAAIPKLENNEQVCAVGLNCVAIDVISEYLPKISKLTKKPIVVYPKIAKPVRIGDVADVDVADDDGDVKKLDVAGLAKKWQASGANIVGGCCGTSLQFVRDLSKF